VTVVGGGGDGDGGGGGWKRANPMQNTRSTNEKCVEARSTL